MLRRLRILAAKLRGLGGRRAGGRQFDDEMHAHLRLLAERFLRQGMTPAEAEAAARRQFGNVALLQEDRREMQTIQQWRLSGAT